MRGRRSLRRASPSRAPKRRFVIFSEGRNTEPNYFRAIRSELLGALVEVEIIDAAGVPMTIAEKAATHAARMAKGSRRRSSFEEADQVWAVFDRDEHPDVENAIKRCRAKKVGIAFSDPCFELWLVLHFREFDRPDDRHRVQAELEKVCPGYDRKSGKSPDCAKLMPDVAKAEERAEAQLVRREAEGGKISRPSTTVHHLTLEMRKAHKAYTGTTES